MYSPDRLKLIGVEAAKEVSVFSIADRVGLVHDAFALAKADLLKMSDALSLVFTLRSEKECKCKSKSVFNYAFSPAHRSCLDGYRLESREFIFHLVGGPADCRALEFIS